MLGGGAIGGSTNPGAKRVAGGLSRSTLLTSGAGAASPTNPGGGGFNPKYPTLDF